MNKIETNIIENLQLLCLNNEKDLKNKSLCFHSVPFLYSLFVNHLNYHKDNPNWINKDRLLVSNNFLTAYYAMLHLCYKEITYDNLKDNNSFLGITNNIAIQKTPGIEVGSIKKGDIIGSAIGVSLGEKYLESLVKIENPKSDLINFYTYCFCTKEDLYDALSYEAMSFASELSLQKLIFIVMDDSSKNDFKENLVDRFSSLNFEFETIKESDIATFNNVIKDAKKDKQITVLVIKTKDSSEEELKTKIAKYQNKDDLNEEIINKNTNDFAKIISKRTSTVYTKWLNNYNEAIKDIKIKEICDFLNNKKIKLNFKPENIKISDDYCEELLISNNKIFNVFASKNPFILNLSDIPNNVNHFQINKPEYMSKNNATGRNIYFNGRTFTMGSIACGLSSLGFKVFVTSSLVNESLLNNSIKISIVNKLNITYIFTHDTFLNPYTGVHPVDEIDHLNNLPDFITFRPCDINEIIGVYDFLTKYGEATAIILGNNKVKMNGTNAKYVAAGAYPIRKEREEVNALIIASGSEVEIASKIANELAYYGILLRVVSMPSPNLFALQSERYQTALIPGTIKTFVLQFYKSNLAYRYVTNKEYILEVNKFTWGGMKEEILNAYNLNVDAIKAKIIELMKK